VQSLNIAAYLLYRKLDSCPSLYWPETIPLQCSDTVHCGIPSGIYFSSLIQTELLDQFTPTINDEAIENMAFTLPQDEEKIGFSDSIFTWSNSNHGGAATPSKRRFTLRIDGELFFKRNCFNIIIGPTGMKI
jgi:hypothetical protein